MTNWERNQIKHCFSRVAVKYCKTARQINFKMEGTLVDHVKEGTPRKEEEKNNLT
jgi:hypothetical protein